jgi:hypothetical protein
LVDEGLLVSDLRIDGLNPLPAVLFCSGKSLNARAEVKLPFLREKFLSTFTQDAKLLVTCLPTPASRSNEGIDVLVRNVIDWERVPIVSLKVLPRASCDLLLCIA